MTYANNKHCIIVLLVETPRKFITAVINLRGVSTNKTIIYFIAMQTYKELNKHGKQYISNKQTNLHKYSNFVKQ
jgi:hypothetical protein